MNSSTDTFTELDCHCVRHEGSVGQELYCSRHRRVSVVVRAAPEWVIACVTCTYSKREGLAEVTAFIDAQRHARRRQHRIHVFHGARLVEELGPRAPGQMPLFGKDGTQGG